VSYEELNTPQALEVKGYTETFRRPRLLGARNYMLELPIVPGPGGIGRVRAVGRMRPDSQRATRSSATRRSARDDATDPDSILLGWTAHDEAALPLHRSYHNGS
jgi:alcohol dehydrogenase